MPRPRGHTVVWRRQSTAALASVTAHGALAALVAIAGRGGERGREQPEEEELVELTEVEIWRDEPQVEVGGGSGLAIGGTAPTARPRPASRRREGRAALAIAETHGEGGRAGPTEKPGEPTRITEGVPLLDPARTAAIAEPDRGPPPPPQPLEMRVPTLRISPRAPRSELAPDGNGRFRTDEGPYVAHVERDGRVSFEDRSSIGVRLPNRREIKQALREWARDPFGESPDQTPPLIQGRFELTDLAMRAAGMDPYAGKKMDYLDRTREERMRLAAAENSGNLRDALARTPSTLQRIWSGPGDLASKRRLLFTLWDECAETGSSEVLATARAVRATVVAFVRRRLPRGSRAGYSDQELEALNARRTSRQRFEPYAP